MRHYYISVALFALVLGVATGTTIVVAGKALEPHVVAATPTPPAPRMMHMTSYGHHWHWHGMEEAIRDRVAAELDKALAKLDDVDVDVDVDDDAPTITATPVVTVR